MNLVTMTKPKYKMMRVKCIVCGKDCAQSMHGVRDATWVDIMPRKHYINGKVCEGTWKECYPEDGIT